MAFPWCLPQHLVQWDAGNSECLLQLVKELIQQYHNYQCERLRESSRLLFEYDSLLEDPDYGRNMEIYAGKKNSWVSDCFNTLRHFDSDFSDCEISWNFTHLQTKGDQKLKLAFWWANCWQFMNDIL